MCVEVAIETGAGVAADRRARKADHMATAAAQVTQRQRGQLRRRQARQALDATAREAVGIVDCVGHLADKAERGLPIAAAQQCWIGRKGMGHGDAKRRLRTENGRVRLPTGKELVNQ